MTGNKNGGRVTTAQFHQAQLEQIKEMGNLRLELSSMELRIVEKINEGIKAQQEYQKGTDAKLATDKTRLDNHDDVIKNLKIWDRALGILSIIGSVFGIGIKQ